MPDRFITTLFAFFLAFPLEGSAFNPLTSTSYSSRQDALLSLRQRPITPFPIAGDDERRIRMKTTLFAWSKRGNSGLKSKKKTNNKNQGKNKRRSGPTGGKNSVEKKSTGPKQQKRGNNSHKSSPPWQVMSEKEAKLNIEKEKERREKARQGIHTAPSLDVSEPKVKLSKSFLNEADQRFLKWKRFNPVTAPNGMRFVGSYLDKRLPPALGVPEVAFLGRSNVGKSSLLNRLFSTATATDGSSDQARVGKTPGATASVNLYALTTPASKQQRQQNMQQKRTNTGPGPTKDLLAFADLPGFGYAKLSKEIQESVQEAAENYLNKRRELALGILLVDIRRAPPTDDDRGVLAALYDMGVPLLVVATKVDKIKNVDQRNRNLEEIRKGLGLPEGQPLAISSVTGEGCKPLWSIILETCETHVNEFRETYEDVAEEDEDEEEEEDSPVAREDQLPFVDEYDDDEISYDMGYDWLHGEDYGDYADDGLLDYADDFSDDDVVEDEWSDDFEDQPTDVNIPRQSETMRSLKQRARDMERKGQV